MLTVRDGSASVQPIDPSAYRSVSQSVNQSVNQSVSLAKERTAASSSPLLSFPPVLCGHNNTPLRSTRSV